VPSSSNPLNLLSAWLLALMGVPCTLLGVVGTLAESGSMRLVWGMLALGGLGMTWGAVQAVVAWRRAEVRERGHEAALYAAARGHSPGSAPAARTAYMEAGTAAAAPQAAPATADAEVLAHWTYAPDEWSEYTRRDLSFRKGEALWIGLGVLLLGTLLLVNRENTPYGIAIGVSAFVGGAIYVGRLLQARSAHAANAATRGGEVIISPHAVLLNGRYHVLQDDRFHFGGVRLLDEDGPPVLEFTVTWMTRGGPTNEQVYVPVPRGREAEARALAASFPERPGTAGTRG
jgi:hypothetical protein